MRKIDGHMHFCVASLAEALVTMDRNDIEYAINARIVDPTPGLEMLKASEQITGGRIVTLSSFEGDGICINMHLYYLKILKIFLH